MKKILGIFTVFFIVIFMTVNLMANIGNVPGLKKGTNVATTQVTRTMSNISNWGYWIYYDGKSAQQPNSSSGGIYPRGTAGAIYMDGFVWGGKVGDDIRVGGQTYNIGTQPGCIEADGTATDATDPKVKVYRIRSDWETLTASMVKQDAMELNELSSLSSVTESMTDAVIAQYEEDWNEWPVDLGAPWTDVDGDGEYDPTVDEAGIADADQVIWLVVNDLSATRTLGLYGSPPIGLELQITMWAYNQPGARLGQIVFKKYKLINKSGGDIDEMYVSQWADPDLGDYGDDFVGCDTTLSMGFAYNGADSDAKYAAFGLAPAAFGYDFFQGPIVESAGDTAVFDLKQKIGYKNLPMSTFGWFAAGSDITDPELGDPEGTRQWYNMLRGYKPFDDLDNPSPWTEGNVTGAPTTKFPLAGDPVAGTGFIDGADSYFDPGDRRMALTAGPFTFADGDTQEVVVAAIGGLGDTRLASVTDLKETDVVAQMVYNDLFSSIPKAPAGPSVNVTSMEDEIMLEWGSDITAVNATEVPVISGYAFEGYNVYQLKTPTSTGNDAKKIATYDLNNGVKTIEGTRYVSRNGVQLPATVILQNGADGGLIRYFHVEKNYFTGGDLREGTTYYFAVTAYNYNAAPELIEDKALESAKIVLSVTVQEELPGTSYDAEPNEDVTVTYTGSNDGQVIVKVIDPAKVNGHDYEIFFTYNSDSSALLFNVRDVDEGGTVVASDVPQVVDLTASDDQPIFDGLQAKVAGPLAGTKLVKETDASDVLVDDGVTAFSEVGGPSLGSTGYLLSNRAGAVNQPPYARDWDRFGYWGTDDIEINFGETSLTWDYLSEAVHLDSLDDSPYYAPFSVYRHTVEGNTYRLFAGFWDSDGDGTWNNNGADWAGPIYGAPSYEPIYCWQGYDASGNPISYDPANDATYIADNWLGEPTTANTTWGSSTGNIVYPYITAMLFTEYLGGPPIGNKVWFLTNKPNTLTDVFTFTAPEVTQNDSVMAVDIDKVNVFPNPFYAHNPLASHRYDEYVTFTHLPENATIQIYNLAGVLVNTVEHSNANSQFEQWDLTNASDLPVASGIYIAYIDMPDENASKTLKFVIIQKEQILEYY